MSGPNLRQHHNNPLWPVGYPYRCAIDYFDRALNVYTLRVGAEGKVVNRSQNTNNPNWVAVTVPGRSPIWVAFNHLQIGTDYLYGDIHAYAADPTIRDSIVLQLGNTVKDPLRRALEQLAFGLKDNIEICWWLPPWFSDRIRNDGTRNNLINVIYQGMVDKVRTVLNRPNFTIRDLITTLEPVTPQDNKPAIYTRIYYAFKDKHRLPSQYIGKSVEPWNRDVGHDYTEELEKRSNHYKTSRAAQRKLMSIICHIDEPHFRAAAEQFFVLLFQCYTTAVLTFQAAGPSAESDAAESTDAAAVSEKTARWIADKEAAVTMQMIADKAFIASGWPGGRSRESYGAGNGCNWNSPITEMFSREATIWTMQQFPAENFDVFRRSPIQVCKRDNAADVSSSLNIYVVMEIKSASTLISESRGKFIPNLPKDIGIPVGTWVQPIIEMTKDGKPHRRRYDRLPGVGPWNDWDLACSRALKIGWQDADDQWLSQHLCASRVLRARRQPKTYLAYNEPGAVTSYAQVVAVAGYLRQTTLLQEDRPQWLYDCGVASQRAVCRCLRAILFGATRRL